MKFGRHMIPFEFRGQVLTLPITRYTTCDDVVHKLFPSENKEAREKYIICEITSMSARVLSGNNRVYSAWRCWEKELTIPRFVIINVERCSEVSTRVSEQSEENSTTCENGIRSNVNLKNIYVEDSETINTEKTKSKKREKYMVVSKFLRDLRQLSTKMKPASRKTKSENDTSLIDNSDVITPDADEPHDIQSITDSDYVSDEVSSSFDEDAETTGASLDTGFVTSHNRSLLDDGSDVMCLSFDDLNLAFIGNTEGECPFQRRYIERIGDIMSKVSSDLTYSDIIENVSIEQTKLWSTEDYYMEIMASSIERC